MRFHTELRDLRQKLDSTWHDKLNLLEEIASNPDKFIEHFAVGFNTLDSLKNTKFIT